MSWISTVDILPRVFVATECGADAEVVTRLQLGQGALTAVMSPKFEGVLQGHDTDTAPIEHDDFTHVMDITPPLPKDRIHEVAEKCADTLFDSAWSDGVVVIVDDVPLIARDSTRLYRGTKALTEE